jgi:(E)-4-hydroxy-3-methyl-but-2-enyl pyrophosphate reductase
MGVRRAMEMVLTEANKDKGSISTFGPLIHNKQVIDLLESKGVTSINDIDDFNEGTLVIRAHGIPPDQRKALRESGLRLIDATCPRVARVQSIIRYHTKKGYTAIIVGDRDHPEVIGLLGYGNGRAQVINSLEEVSKIPDTEKVFLVAQTTQDKEKYRDIIAAVMARFPDALTFDTICDATTNRQKEIRSFVGQVDALVVVGGYHSGNTKRLVQISQEAGLPTFHVETEKDLDKERLSSMEVIGVTAGASTPNWMIKNVVQEIEAIRTRRETFFGRWIKNAFKFMLLSNLLVAFGGFTLAYAAAVLSGRTPDLIHPCLALLYIYAMHVLNRFLDKGASTYNDPERAGFYRTHRVFLILSGVFSMIGALALSFYLGTPIFFAIAGLSILGILYSLPIVPVSLRHLWRYSKIKDIPGSKTLSVALAWAVLISILPLLEPTSLSWPAAVVSFLFVFSMVYARSALFDIFQVQGDLIVGVETLPIVLGERRTLHLLKWIILSGVLLLTLAAVTRLVGPFSWLLLLVFFSFTLCLLIYQKRWLYPGTRLEAMVEGNFFLAGLLALLWQIFS